ncbi:nucleoside deaminase [Clostridium sp. HMP27]|uniref:nucleoside deaminase n=1 Tax=Clostridium sp. HMP27 TaxID=1487921 RepID=UPI00052BE65C|nr:nucleoside deaminase [Clostridium sp. HMP27]KGK86393.1 adenosine deaminase [Clostridium sp. HMP27]
MRDNFLLEAIKEAKKAEDLGEVPVGAVIVQDNKIIARAHNMIEVLKDPTAHAEVLAIRRACEFTENWRLSGCELYVTLEPCPMCAGAIYQSRINKVYIGTFDPISGACGSVINVLQNNYLNSNIDVRWIYNKECSVLLKSFFKSKRK